MVTIGVLGWLTSTAVELLGRRLTRWLPRTSYVTGPRPKAPRAATTPLRRGTASEAGEARHEHLV
jgi:NitT/TauT family transport system permease protein